MLVYDRPDYCLDPIRREYTLLRRNEVDHLQQT